MAKGLFISFEGGDGAGKSTQIRCIKEYYEAKGRSVLVTREPGGTPIGEKIRDLLLDISNSEMDSVTETLLYAASRAQHVNEVIKPALSSGMVVITDRFCDSSYAYQAYARGLGEMVFDINNYAMDGCIPDITFFLNLDPLKGRQRIVPGTYDRIESEKIDFHQKVREGYESLIERYPDRIVVIDADRPIEEISRDVLSYLERIIDDI